MRYKLIFSLFFLLCLFPLTATAGNIDSPGTAPSLGSGLYTLDDLYNYLISGTAAPAPGPFQEPAAGPASSSKTTKEIYDDIKSNFDLCDATPDEVLDSVTFFSTNSASWGPQTGNPSTQTPDNTTVSQSLGFYNAFNLSTVDADLDAANIKSGTDIFGLTGTFSQTATPAAATDILTGKTAFVNGAQVDGSMSVYSGAAAKTYTPGTADVTVDTGYHNGSKVSGDADLTAVNIKSGVDVFGVTGTFNSTANGAVATDILTGKTAFVNGAQIDGSMSDFSGAEAKTYTPGTADVTIDTGYHNGSKVLGDANLVTGNIRSGVTIFGMAGKTEVVDTTSGDAIAVDIASGKKAWVDGNEITGVGTALSYPAPVEKTGQTATVPLNPAPTGSDGNLQKGASTSPAFRFTDNNDGTVTDNLTGLIWLKNANCFGGKNWGTAKTDCNGLAAGVCGLSDGSSAGDWRLPNVKELQSLIDFKYFNPSLSNAAGTGKWLNDDPFTGVQSFYYWSSSASAFSTASAWNVDLDYGSVRNYVKTSSLYVWPVRAGQ